MILWDTSALLKLYAWEADSEAYLQLLRDGSGPIGVSELAVVELHYALWRKEASGALVPGATDAIAAKFRSDIVAGRVLVVPSGSDVTGVAVEVARACLCRTPPLSLRTLDGIHLAAALTAKASGLVTTDHWMREAAAVLNLPLMDPSRG